MKTHVKEQANRNVAERLTFHPCSIPCVVLLAMLHLPCLAAEAGNPRENTTTPVANSSQTWQTVTARKLPALGNTTQLDRYFLREVTDHEIYENRLARKQSLPDNDAKAIIDTPAHHPHKAVSVWDIVRESRRISIPDNQRIDFHRRQYHDEAFWVSKILQRAKPFAGYIVESLETRYLPAELAVLPAIESGYRPDAYSKRDAAGLWQLIPATADEIGVVRTPWFDGRNDIRLSTKAAMDYLSYLNAEFNGDWLLTLAAYNAGPGRVRREIEKNTLNGIATDFWSLNLPAETRNYVPKFLAFLAMLRHDHVVGLEVPATGRGAAFDVVTVSQRMNLNTVSTLTGLQLKDIKQLNTALEDDITPPAGPHVIYLPKGYERQFLAKLHAQPGNKPITPVNSHTVAAGDSVSGIAAKYGISQSRLMKLNLLQNSDIQIGQVLYVSARHPSGGDFTQYIVTIGDTLSDIAARFSVTVANIRDEYGQVLTSDIIHPGEKLSVGPYIQSGLLQ